MQCLDCMHDQPHLGFHDGRVEPIEDRWERMIAGTPWVASCTVTVDVRGRRDLLGPRGRRRALLRRLRRPRHARVLHPRALPQARGRPDRRPPARRALRALAARRPPRCSRRPRAARSRSPRWPRSRGHRPQRRRPEPLSRMQVAGPAPQPLAAGAGYRCMDLLRRALPIAVLCLLALTPAIARADTPVAVTPGPTNVASYGGFLAWSQYDTGGQEYALVVRNGSGTPKVIRAASSPPPLPGVARPRLQRPRRRAVRALHQRAEERQRRRQRVRRLPLPDLQRVAGEAGVLLTARRRGVAGAMARTVRLRARTALPAREPRRSAATSPIGAPSAAPAAAGWIAATARR